MNPIVKQFKYGQHTVTLETGAIARQATAAVMASMDDTTVFVTVVAKKDVKEGQDFILKRVIKNMRQLIDAGQKKIIMDGLYTWSEYKILLHEFPGQVTVVALVIIVQVGQWIGDKIALKLTRK